MARLDIRCGVMLGITITILLFAIGISLGDKLGSLAESVETYINARDYAHGIPALKMRTARTRRAAALTTDEIRKLSRAYGTGLAGARDRALILVGFAGALRRSELVGLDFAHVVCRMAMRSRRNRRW
jgi:integrase